VPRLSDLALILKIVGSLDLHSAPDSRCPDSFDEYFGPHPSHGHVRLSSRLRPLNRDRDMADGLDQHGLYE